MQRAPRDLSGLLVGPAATALLALGIAALSLPGLRIPNPGVAFIAAIMYSSVRGGVASGLASMGITLCFELWYRFTPGPPHYEQSDVERLLVLVAVMPIVVLAMSRIKERLAAGLARERALRTEAEAERRHAETILENLADDFFAVDTEWRYTYVNRRAEALVGRPRSELLGKSIWEAFPPLVGSKFDVEYRRAVAEQRSVHFEALYPPLDSWFEVDAYPSSEGLSIFLRSIDERKRAEAALAARALQQGAVARLGVRALGGESAPSLADAAVRLVAETLGVELAKFLEIDHDGGGLLLRAGVGWRDGLVGRARVDAGPRSQAGYTLSSGAPVIVEDLASETRFSGPALLLEHGVVSGLSVIVEGTERPYGVIGAHTTKRRAFSVDDINFLQAVANVLALKIERRRAYDALAESEGQLQQIAENIHEVLFLEDAPEPKMRYVSPPYDELFGRPRQRLETAPRDWLEAVHSEDRAALELTLSSPGAHPLDREFRIVRKGDVRWVRARTFPLRNAEGEVYRVIGVVTDLTDRKRIEESARSLLLEQAARSSAEASVRARDEVLAFVAHDLRNPLGAIMLTAGTLQHPLEDEVRVQHARRIVRSARTMNRLIDDLLDLARIEAGRFQVELMPVDVAALIEEAIETHRLQAAEKGVALERSIEAGASFALGDSSRLLQALSNLVANALKFTPGRGTITLAAETIDGAVRLSVRDTGPGIAEGEIAHVFDRFWQAKNADRRGVGLGLAIVKAIVEAHGSTIAVESAVGRGTTFHFALQAPVMHDASA